MKHPTGHYRIKELSRRTLAVVWFLAVVAALAFAIGTSFRESRIDWWLGFPRPFVPLSFDIFWDSIDEVSGKVQIHATPKFDREILVIDPETKNMGSGTSAERFKVFFSPFTIFDLGEGYRSAGLWLAQSEIGTARLKKPPQNFTHEVPGTVHQYLTAIGNPRLYPFDRYLVMGRLYWTAMATVDGKQFATIPGEYYSMEFRIPGFKFREATGKELERWDSASKRTIDYMTRTQSTAGEDTKGYLADIEQSYKPELWHKRRFAIVLMRPYFLQYFTCFLGTIALASVIGIGFSSKPKQLAINAIAYFLGLWGVRGALSADAPKTATLIDYAVLVFYGLLVATVVCRLLWGFPRSEWSGE